MAWSLCCESVSILLVFLSFGNCVLLNLGRSGHQTRPQTTIEDRIECMGTFNALSTSGDSSFRYMNLRRRYSRCTHVLGNLEITHLESNSIDYDLSFLQDIRYVSGYVLIAVVTSVPVIPLHSLEIIRGNYTFDFNGDSYGLAVLLTYPFSNRAAGLKELQLPSLKEITNGKVVFQRNPSLGFVDTIDWQSVVRHRDNAVDFSLVPYNQSVSSTYLGLECPSGRMWGRGICQSDIPNIQCHPTCDGRCFGSGSGECCHATCAVGCHGPTNQDCLLCKDYEYNSGCVGFCPARTHPEAQICVSNY